MDKQTYRDYCAAMAMQGLIIQNAPVSRDAIGLAKAAYEKADAMVAEREKRTATDPGAPLKRPSFAGSEPEKWQSL